MRTKSSFQNEMNALQKQHQFELLRLAKRGLAEFHQELVLENEDIDFFEIFDSSQCWGYISISGRLRQDSYHFYFNEERRIFLDKIKKMISAAVEQENYSRAHELQTIQRDNSSWACKVDRFDINWDMAKFVTQTLIPKTQSDSKKYLRLNKDGAFIITENWFPSYYDWDKLELSIHQEQVWKSENM